MEQMILKPEILDRIKKDQILFGKVSSAMGLSIRTVFELLPSNPPRLATASVLKVLREHLKIKNDKDLLTEAPVAAENNG